MAASCPQRRLQIADTTDGLMTEGYRRLANTNCGQPSGAPSLKPHAPCFFHPKLLHDLTQLHAWKLVCQIGVTSIKVNKYNDVAIHVTPVTRVTPHLNRSKPRSPMASIPPANFRSISRGLQGPLRLSLRYGVRNPPDFVSGQVPSLVNR